MPDQIKTSPPAVLMAPFQSIGLWLALMPPTEGPLGTVTPRLVVVALPPPTQTKPPLVLMLLKAETPPAVLEPLAAPPKLAHRTTLSGPPAADVMPKPFISIRRCACRVSVVVPWVAVLAILAKSLISPLPLGFVPEP